MLAVSPISRLTIGLILLTVSLLLIGDLLGLAPDQRRAELEARKSIAEALAVQLSSDIPAGRMDAVKTTMSALQQRNKAIVSVGLRTADGQLLSTVGDHEKYWTVSENDKSSASHVQVPIHDKGGRWGALEMSFSQQDGYFADLLSGGSIAAVVVFIAISGFIAYSLFLKRALKELDPSAVVPDRVREALDVLTEGLVIIDCDQRIVLANAAFERKLGQSAKTLVGNKLSDLEWRTGESDTPASLQRLPWQILLEDEVLPSMAQLKLHTEAGDLFAFAVNAAPIKAADGVIRGVVVTFDDVTEMERKNIDLEYALDQLKHSQREITRQNRELQILATRDPLSGMLNRRSLFEGMAVLLHETTEVGTELSCIMVDIDHFKSVNDRFGHAVGDKVIKLVAKILSETARTEDLIGRYGGEEFCIALPGADEQQAAEVAERMRKAIHEGENAEYISAIRVSASFGVASSVDEINHPGELVDHADKALYGAKRKGRNRVVRWSDLRTGASTASQEGDPVVPASQQSTSVHPINAEESQLSNSEKEILENRIAMLESFIRQQSQGENAGLDEATGLPSRVVLVDRIRQVVARCQRLGTRLAVLSISIDTVELINNTLGHGTAEKVVRLAAGRLKNILRSTDTIAAKAGKEVGFSVSRIAASEFAVLLTDMTDAESATWIVQRMFAALREPVELDGNEFLLDTNVGISLFPGDGEDPETLLAHASAALREARNTPGREVSVFYSKDINQRSRDQIRMEGQLHRALERDELYLEYQPSVDLRTGRIITLEALLRWRHPEWGVISPMVFIPIAEHTGLINEIGEWVLSTASRQLKAWQQAGYDQLAVSVNFSAVQFRKADLAERIISIVQAQDLAPGSLVVEITESALIQNLDTAVAIVDGLNNAGFRVALDDFGTGYSSLSYLKRFPIDLVKIDRSFLSDFPDHGQDTAIVSAIIAMAHGLGLRVIAEGVEKERQLEILQDLHCDEIQGFLFSRPLSREQITALMDKPTDIRRIMHSVGKFPRNKQWADNAVVTGVLNAPPSRITVH